MVKDGFLLVKYLKTITPSYLLKKKLLSETWNTSCRIAVPPLW